ncbi:MAG: Lysophospholipase L1 [Chloroflexi bacterium]|jgi:lysophospholipase L1-like esterase|nr:MAG: Lysophospholipase L1 [Chloroflexota bacterium]
MGKNINPDDTRLKWKGVVSTEATKEGVMAWRIPFTQKDLFAWQLAERAAMPAGVRLEFGSNTSYLEMFFDSIPDRSPVDIFCDGELLATLPTANLNFLRVENLGSKNKAIQIWLPQWGELRIKKLVIENDAILTEPKGPKDTKWVTYGSSITQCRTADSPSQTWPALVARKNDLDLTCMGYGGQCHLDPMIARTIRDLPADIISLCLGINIYGASSLNQRTFQPGILGFVQILREKHIDTPIIVMSPIYSPGREENPNEVGMTLQVMRSEIEDSVEVLRSLGDLNIHYIDGLNIFDKRYEKLLPDNLHPNNEGYSIMASNISDSLAPYLCFE